MVRPEPERLLEGRTLVDRVLMDDDPSRQTEICWRSRLAPIGQAVLRRAVDTTLELAGSPAAQLSLAFVDDAEMKAVHERHRGEARPTDVLSFNLSDSSDSGIVDGEIIVSAETAARMAAALETSVESEILLYIVHGLLHLLGYDDQEREAAAHMRDLEKRVFRNLGRAEPRGR